VRVVNISGTFHKAATVATALTALGYQVTGTATGPVPAGTTETVVRYPPGSVAAALGLLGDLSGAVLLAPDPTITDGSLTLDVGSVLAVAPPAPPPAATPAAAAPAPGATAAPTTSIPTALHQSPSSAQDQAQSFDPTACP
jgi:hypothetical protein